jgi:hypothetical protein
MTHRTDPPIEVTPAEREVWRIMLEDDLDNLPPATLVETIRYLARRLLEITAAQGQVADSFPEMLPDGHNGALDG